MASSSLQKKIKFTAFAENRNEHNQGSFDPTCARLEDSRDSPQRPKERRSTADLTHARMLQLQELGLAATVINTQDNKVEPQGFVEASKYEAKIDSMQEELSSLINKNSVFLELSSGRKAMRCNWIYKAKTRCCLRPQRSLGGKRKFPETRNRL
jgi:hypothetical protein